MLILLPPSETKRDGGRARRALDFGRLRWSQLTAKRCRLVDSLIELAADEDAAASALRLGPRQRGELARNRAIASAPVMPALERYSGVLYDAIDVAGLDAAARRRASAQLAVHSALFGLIGAADPIPGYRLSADSRLPGVRLRTYWSEAITAVLEGERGPILDLRSQGYVRLGPLPRRKDAVPVRVVTPDRERGLNHFNKRSKGLFVRALLRSERSHRTVDDVLDWAADAGFQLDRGDGELRLVEVREAVSAEN